MKQVLVLLMVAALVGAEKVARSNKHAVHDLLENTEENKEKLERNAEKSDLRLSDMVVEHSTE